MLLVITSTLHPTNTYTLSLSANYLSLAECCSIILLQKDWVEINYKVAQGFAINYPQQYFIVMKKLKKRKLESNMTHGRW